MTIQMTIEPATPSFTVGEAVTFRLTIQNTGAQTVTVADPLLNEINPVYSVTGPNGTVTQVQLLSARVQDPRLEPHSPPAVLTMEIPAGDRWSEEITLDPMLMLQTPGQYALLATLDSEGTPVVSPEVTVTIEAARVSAYGWAAVPPKTLESRLFTAWANKGQAGWQIVEALRLDRAWGNDKNGKLYSSTLKRGLGGPIRQIAVAEPLFLRGMDFHGWVAWTEPGRLFAIRSNAGRPEGDAEVVYESDSEFRLIGPLAMDSSYDVRIYAIERGDDGAAELIRLDIAREPGSTAKITSRTALPFMPGTALALHREGEATVLALGAAQEHQTVIAVFEDGPAPRISEIGRLGAWISGCPLAAQLSANGAVQVGCLAVSPEDPHLAQFYSAVVGRNPVAVRSQSRVDMEAVDPTDTRWVSLALGNGGMQLVWRDARGDLHYRDASGTLHPLEADFADEPLPSVITADGKAFLAGVREDGAFSIIVLGPQGHGH